MGLKVKIKAKDEIPTEHLPFYAERDGGWVLEVEGAVFTDDLGDHQARQRPAQGDRATVSRKSGDQPGRVQIIDQVMRGCAAAGLAHPVAFGVIHDGDGRTGACFAGPSPATLDA